ncbi:MAG: hypothetical protein JRI39_05270 [Deltaproteobacteria bacterium]|nr:hypothetical protein [Deltaproteobacteria bacterium]MBW2082501.1 hypothetical protein [Deltaproteobacteria bacterium]
MDPEKETRELDEVLDLFISSNENRRQAPWAKTNSKEKPEKVQDASPPLVETTRVEKEITCPAGAKAQDKIRGLLFEHLQADYEITRVELKKATDRREQDREIHTEERISLTLKDP